MTPKRVVWTGNVPLKDDFNYHISDTFIDGRTALGSWAIMTPQAHRIFGLGLGVGLGQKYQQINNQWVKVEG